MFSLHKISVSGLLICLFSSVSGNDPYLFSAGAGETGMNYSCIMKPGFWSSFHNQALLPLTTSGSFGFTYQSRFNISELGTRSAGLIIPAGRTCLGAVYSHFGYRDFIRHSAGIACGLRLSEKISAGVQTDYFSEKTPGEYDERQSLTFEAGLLIKPSENILVGLHLFNPVPGSLRKRFLPSSLRAGAGIYLNKLLFACAEAEISTGKDLIIKTGFEYEPVKSLRLRGGFSSENTSFSCGIGYLFKNVQLDFGFAAHDRLGITSSASVIFNLRNKSL